MFIPDARNKNSYQTNLSDHLSKYGVSVHFDRNVLRCIKRNWPDILHIHWTYPFMMAKNRPMTIIKSTRFIIGLSLLKLLGVKIIWTVHNIADHERRFRLLELLFTRLLAKSCDKLIVHCPFAMKEVMKIYNRNSSSVTVIPHGSYVGYYKNTMTYLQTREKLGFNLEDVVFLYFGQIRSYKGVPELIDAFKKLNDSRAKLLIVGKSIDNKISENIIYSCRDNDNIKTILEFVPDDDIQIYMNAADIVVLPYRDILTSGAAILSMSFGKPIMSPAIGCITDLLNEKGGFLYSAKMEKGLFETMQHVLNIDKTTLANMGRYNLRLTEQFQWSDVAKKTYDVYVNNLNKNN